MKAPEGKKKFYVLGGLVLTAVILVGFKLVDVLNESSFDRAEKSIHKYYNADQDVSVYLKIFASETGLKDFDSKSDDELADHYFSTLRMVHARVQHSYLSKIYGKPYKDELDKMKKSQDNELPDGNPKKAETKTEDEVKKDKKEAAETSVK